MTRRYLLLTAALLMSTLVALQATAQITLPANVQADQANVKQDKQLLQSAKSQLQTDEAAGNNDAVTADRTALRLAGMKVAQDMGALRQGAQPILQPDLAALTAALTQLHADQVANNTSAVVTDQAAVTAAEQQLHTDHKAIFGGFGGGRGPGHWHPHM